MEKHQPCGFLKTIFHPVTGVVVIIAALLYLLFLGGMIIEKEKQLCQKRGGVYVRVYNGFECIKDYKTINVKRNSHDH